MTAPQVPPRLLKGRTGSLCARHLAGSGRVREQRRRGIRSLRRLQACPRCRRSRTARPSERVPPPAIRLQPARPPASLACLRPVRRASHGASAGRRQAALGRRGSRLRCIDCRSVPPDQTIGRMGVLSAIRLPRSRGGCRSRPHLVNGWVRQLHWAAGVVYGRHSREEAGSEDRRSSFLRH